MVQCAGSHSDPRWTDGNVCVTSSIIRPGGLFVLRDCDYFNNHHKPLTGYGVRQGTRLTSYTETACGDQVNLVYQNGMWGLG